MLLIRRTQTQTSKKGGLTVIRVTVKISKEVLSEELYESITGIDDTNYGKYKKKKVKSNAKSCN